MEDSELLKRKRFLKTKVCVVLATCVFTLLLIISFFSEQQWILYHACEIKGAVMEAETGKPIENAIVIGMWALVQVPGEGFGGYAKISVVTTDKEGKFIIPSWTTFKPWKICALTHGLAPKLIFYKPGYGLHWSHKVGREGYIDDMSKTEEEKRKIKEANSLNPAKLKRVSADEEIWRNYLSFRSEVDLSTDDYTIKQFKKIFDLIKRGLVDLPKETYGIQGEILNNMKQFED
ncbi:MAG: peptidase associated/transthyretin-like domain-containing protein [Thermodesulfovibrionales bacterium]